METALYFPRIRVPESAWFSQVLLYWESVGTIVPNIRGADSVSRYMQQLRQENLLKFISPEAAVREHRYQLANEFAGLIERDPTFHGVVPERWTKIHVEKMEMNALGALGDLGLARPAEGGLSIWWEVEERAARVYMSFLVGLICGASPGFVPVTDNAAAINALNVEDQASATRLQQLRFSTLLSVLPVPDGPMPAADIKAFKEQYSQDLQRMRIALDAALTEVLLTDDVALREAKAIGVRQEISDEIARLIEGMQQRRWPRVVFMGIGGVLGASLALVGSILTGGSALAVGVAIGAGVSSVAGAGYQALDILKAPKFDAHSPYVYAAMAQLR